MAFSLTQRPVPAAPGDFAIHGTTGSEAISYRRSVPLSGS